MIDLCGSKLQFLERERKGDRKIDWLKGDSEIWEWTLLLISSEFVFISIFIFFVLERIIGERGGLNWLSVPALLHDFGTRAVLLYYFYTHSIRLGVLCLSIVILFKKNGMLFLLCSNIFTKFL